MSPALVHDHRTLLGMMNEQLLAVAPYATHQHFKGGLYRLLGPLHDAETGKVFSALDGSPYLAYRHEYPHERRVWYRSRFEWEQLVEWHDGSMKPRFRELSL